VDKLSLICNAKMTIMATDAMIQIAAETICVHKTV